MSQHITGDIFARFPPTTHVRASACLVARAASTSETFIDFKAITQFVLANFASPQSSQFIDLLQQYTDRHNSPLVFDSIDDEINFTCIESFLAFGSGYRKELHQLTGYGAANTMTFGILGLHMTNDHLDAHTLVSLTKQQIAELFQLPIEEEYEIQPAVRGYRPSQIEPFVSLIHSTIHRIGEKLLQLNKKDFAQYIRDMLHKCYQQVDEKGGNVSDYLMTWLIKDFAFTLDDQWNVIVGDDESFELLLSTVNSYVQKINSVESLSSSSPSSLKASPLTTQVSITAMDQAIPSRTHHREDYTQQNEEKKQDSDEEYIEGGNHDHLSRHSPSPSPSPVPVPSPAQASAPLFDEENIPASAITIHVALYKKVQLLCSNLYSKFSTKDPLFKFPEGVMISSPSPTPSDESTPPPPPPSVMSLPTLTVLADNVIPALLTSLGILHIPQRLQQHIESGKHISSSSAAMLRACTVVACDIIVAMINYIWSHGHDGPSLSPPPSQSPSSPSSSSSSSQTTMPTGPSSSIIDVSNPTTLINEVLSSTYTPSDLHNMMMDIYLNHVLICSQPLPPSLGDDHMRNNHIYVAISTILSHLSISNHLSSSPSSSSPSPPPQGTILTKFSITPSLLDFYFYAILGKTDTYRPIERHIYKKTSFY